MQMVREKILLIDEVDVFFGDEYYGNSVIYKNFLFLNQKLFK